MCVCVGKSIEKRRLIHAFTNYPFVDVLYISIWNSNNVIRLIHSANKDKQTGFIIYKAKEPNKLA
jgi:hypothetical protein